MIALMPWRRAISRASGRSSRVVAGRWVRSMAVATAAGGSSERTEDSSNPWRTASLATRPSAESALLTRKSVRMSWSRSCSLPAANSEPAGPSPSARSAMKPATTTTNPPNAAAPPWTVRRQVRCGLASSAVISTTGSPSAITITAPGNTHSGSPITDVARRASTATASNAAAYRASAGPVRTRGVGSGPVPVVASSARTSSAADWGRSSGALARQRITSSARAGGVSGRASETGGAGSLTCAASVLAGERP